MIWNETTPRNPQPPIPKPRQVVIYATPKNATKGLAKLVSEAAAAAVAAKGSFLLLLLGGSVLNMLGGLEEVKGVDWSKWWVFFVDERNVAHNSPDSNFKGAREALLGRVPIPEDQVRGARRR